MKDTWRNEAVSFRDTGSGRSDNGLAAKSAERADSAAGFWRSCSIKNNSDPADSCSG
jgi:hypothetical protein